MLRSYRVGPENIVGRVDRRQKGLRATPRGAKANASRPRILFITDGKSNQDSVFILPPGRSLSSVRRLAV
jgi:hypothetical protein